MRQIKNRFPLSVIASAVLLAGHSSAWAETHQTSVALESITVESEALDNNSTVGSSTSTVTNAELETNLVRDLDDAVRYEPGVSTTQDARFGISGITIRGLDENRVKLSVDGMDQADAYGPTSTYLRTGRNALDVDSLEKITIEKGGNVVAGSGAFGGSVRYQTKSPASYLNPEGNDTFGSVKLGYKSASNELSETVTVANRQGKLESLVVYTHRDGEETENYYGDSNGDVTMGSDRQSVDPQDNGSDNLLLKGIYHLSEHNKIGLIAEHYESEMTSDLYSESTNSQLRDADDDQTRQRIGIFQEYQRKTPAFDSAAWQLDYQNTKTTNRTNIASTPVRNIERFYEEEAIAFKADANKQLGQHQLRYGINAEQKSLENYNQDTLYSNSRFSPLADADIAGIYLEDAWQVNDRWLLTPAIRFDSYRYSTSGDEYVSAYDDSNNEAFTAQLASEFTITETTSVFGKVGSGFRAPKLDELYYYYSSGRGYAIVPNPDLEPEESLFAEAGVRYETNRGFAEVVAFYNDYNNFIESNYRLGATAENPYGEYTTINLNDVVIKGVEAKGAWSLDQVIGEGWSIAGAIAYADGEDKNSNEALNSISPLTLVTGLGYDAPSEQWGSKLNLTWVASKSASDLAESDSWLATPSHTLVDLTAYYKPTDYVTINAGVFNAFDEEYWVWNDIRSLSNNSANLARYTRAGRNVGVDVTVSF
ncbi:TonB-dependent hemoglobin/transferrin/lactoferrin family receptor [Marinomonas communis]|uniref:TonB-dependent hemoglobin/transferrin/lactoferrin family receptor n=1 Tax=Marinomonas communis TaxID=28254 RepID=UPI001D1919BE|nr:TonB-dependent hemoglobin/transferrin/lactoferrin family receptor [Marinomonas communis]MCC4273883.1 TonB-dependent hemoglobin/transferrin/lactoferrin family receptor [Marinomonas communis]